MNKDNVKKKFKYFFTTKLSQQITDWCDYYKLKGDIRVAKRKVDNCFNDIKNEKIYINGRESKILMDSDRFTALTYVQRSGDYTYEHSACVLHEFMRDKDADAANKYKFIRQYVCPHFKQNHVCHNTKCWMSWRNEHYITAKNEYEHLTTKYSMFWAERMKKLK